jgi:hypothetical protein
MDVCALSRIYNWWRITTKSLNYRAPPHFLRQLITLITMPRSHDVIVPNAIRGVEETVTTHTKYKHGCVHIKEKVVPVVPSRQKSSRQSSKAKKGASSQIQPDGDHGSEETAQTPDEAYDAYSTECLEEQEYDLLEQLVDGNLPQTSVIPLPSPDVWQMLTYCRLPWSNGLSFRTATSGFC